MAYEIKGSLNVANKLNLGEYTTVQRLALTPDNGTLLFDTDLQDSFLFRNSVWVKASSLDISKGTKSYSVPEVPLTSGPTPVPTINFNNTETWDAGNVDLNVTNPSAANTPFLFNNYGGVANLNSVVTVNQPVNGFATGNSLNWGARISGNIATEILIQFNGDMQGSGGLSLSGSFSGVTWVSDNPLAITQTGDDITFNEFQTFKSLTIQYTTVSNQYIFVSSVGDGWNLIASNYGGGPTVKYNLTTYTDGVTESYVAVKDSDHTEILQGDFPIPVSWELIEDTEHITDLQHALSLWSTADVEDVVSGPHHAHHGSIRLEDTSATLGIYSWLDTDDVPITENQILKFKIIKDASKTNAVAIGVNDGVGTNSSLLYINTQDGSTSLVAGGSGINPLVLKTNVTAYEVEVYVEFAFDASYSQWVILPAVGTNAVLGTPVLATTGYIDILELDFKADSPVSNVGLVQQGTITNDTDLGQGIYTLDASVLAFDFTLPSATGSQSRYMLVGGDVALNNATIKVQATESMNSSTDGTFTMSVDNQTILAIDTGAGEWTIQVLGAGTSVGLNSSFLDATQILVASGSTASYNQADVASGFTNFNDGFITRSGSTATLYFDMDFDDDDVTVVDLVNIIPAGGKILSIGAMANNDTHDVTTDITLTYVNGSDTQFSFNRANGIDADVLWRMEVSISGYSELNQLALAGMVPTTPLDRVRLNRLAAFTPTTNVATVIPFDTTVYDTNSMANLTTGEVTIVNSGTYIINSGGFNTTAVNNHQILILVDGVAVVRGGDAKNSSGGQLWAKASITQELVAGQVVTSESFVGQASSLVTGNLPDAPFLEVIQQASAVTVSVDPTLVTPENLIVWSSLQKTNQFNSSIKTKTFSSNGDMYVPFTGDSLWDEWLNSALETHADIALSADQLVINKTARYRFDIDVIAESSTADRTKMVQLLINDIVVRAAWTDETGAMEPAQVILTYNGNITSGDVVKVRVAASTGNMQVNSIAMDITELPASTILNIDPALLQAEDLSRIQVSLLADSNINSLTHADFDEVVFMQGSDLTINASGAIDGLKAGKTYKLTANTSHPGLAIGGIDLRFIDLTSNTQIGQNWEFHSANDATNLSDQSGQEAFFTPLVDSSVGIDYVSGSIGELSPNSTFTVEQLPSTQYIVASSEVTITNGNGTAGQVIEGNGDGTGTWIDNVGSGYTHDFLIADWANAGGLDFLTVLIGVHGVTSPKTVSVWEENAGAYEVVSIQTTISATNSILITMPDSPDEKFNGRIIIG